MNLSSLRTDTQVHKNKVTVPEMTQQTTKVQVYLSSLWTDTQVPKLNLRCAKLTVRGNHKKGLLCGWSVAQGGFEPETD